MQVMISRVVKVHGGGGYVKGIAHKYPYYVASLFEATPKANGDYVYKNVKLICGPYRSKSKCEKEARDWAESENVLFEEGYGSLHNSPVLVKSLMETMVRK